jgi:hypothetical protein
MSYTPAVVVGARPEKKNAVSKLAVMKKLMAKAMTS